MGQEIPRSYFSTHDFDAFNQRLRMETDYLQSCFMENRFTCLHNTGGFEIEAWLVDRNNAVPAPLNEEFLQQLDNPNVVSELALFNVEFNVQPQVLKGNALRLLHDELFSTWEKSRGVASGMDADLMIIGIHPGIRDEDLTLKNMSHSRRYDALNRRVLAMRQGQPLKLDIHGREHLDSVHYDVMLEAAATSFQIHLQVSPEKAVRAFNAAQIISAPLVAVSANAPYVFGHDLWDESRIPLFEQAVDVGDKRNKRVTFGYEYVKNTLFECFRENLESYPVLLPMCDTDEPVKHMAHLRLHNGTIWRWNRPLVDFDESGKLHLRIENRVVPSGPTIADMLANATFFWGLACAMTDQVPSPEKRLPFPVVRQNFYNAAHYSLESSIHWLDSEPFPVKILVRDQLVPMAREGLQELGVDEGDYNYYLDIILGRIDSGQNGACWQRKWVAHHGDDMQMLSRAYLQRQNEGLPVHEWGI